MRWTTGAGVRYRFTLRGGRIHPLADAVGRYGGCEHRQNNGADFRIFGGVGTTLSLDLVQVSEVPLGGDFDFDNDVDGFDFLQWQRGFGSIYDGNNLADWEANYETSAPLASASVAVPESSALLLGVIASAIGCSLRRR